MKAVVLLSGGLDSTVCLKKAVDEDGAHLAMTFDYGQKAAKKEIAAARKICRKLKVKHEVLSLTWLGRLGRSALVAQNSKVPKPGMEAEPESLHKTALDLWVPNRNGIFVNVAAAYAEALGLDTVIAGFNRDEAEFFPDNSVQYMAAANAALRFSTLAGIALESYTAYLSKQEIVKLGKEIGAPIDLLWCCYLGGQEPCGQCQSCVNFRKAMEVFK